MLTENHFKKFLIDEICRKSNADIVDVILEVNNFCRTKEYKRSYCKWRYLAYESQFKSPVKHISEFFQ